MKEYLSYNYLNNLSLKKIIAFLENEQWINVSTEESTNQLAFDSPEKIGKGFRLFLPTFVSEEQIKADGYSRFLKETLKYLSMVYNKPPISVIEMICNFKSCSDSILIKINPNKEATSVALKELISVVSNWADILAFSGTSELYIQTEKGPSKFYSRVSAEAKNFSELCRFGHTFPGSFGLRIYSNFLHYQHNLFSDYPEDRTVIPYPRRIFERIAFGLENIEEATISKSYQPITQNYKKALNANICGALVEILTQNEVNNFKIDFEFDSALDVLPEIKERVATEFAISEENASIIEDARKEMTPLIEPTTVEINGYVVSLKARDATDFDSARTISIESSIDNSRWRSLTISNMRYEDYSLATRAHAVHTEISVWGVLEQIGSRSWRLNDYSKFTLKD